ncbi:hypothetical protein BS47DRAFT_733064 [Hydnum rufescens UP504]|uniref:Uncharacterized protein n=1 Tax=Hydnum rufescens UP504 TaxID=1448309 RepID=A0A9P6DM79_9AGAM|nr:hypothetical protein BS47DRAFT_733064 [Hydnum rufescens UP504]
MGLKTSEDLNIVQENLGRVIKTNNTIDHRDSPCFYVSACVSRSEFRGPLWSLVSCARLLHTVMRMLESRSHIHERRTPHFVQRCWRPLRVRGGQPLLCNFLERRWDDRDLANVCVNVWKIQGIVSVKGIVYIHTSMEKSSYLPLTYRLPVHRRHVARRQLFPIGTVVEYCRVLSGVRGW